MPCYNEWYAYLEPGSPEYLKAKAEVAAQLKALQYVADYYYLAASLALPEASMAEDEGGVGGDEFRIEQPSQEEDEVLDRLTHHLACDGVHCTTIYDAVSLLDTEIPEQAGYARVLLTCAFRLRVMMLSELRTEDGLFSLHPGRWYAVELIDDEFESDDPRRFSPVYIYRVRPLRTGARLLRVRFWHENYHEGAQGREGDWKILERTPGLLLARIQDYPVQLAHIRELSWKWLGDRFRIYPKPGEIDVQARMGEPRV